MMDLVNQNYWDSSYFNLNLDLYDPLNPIVVEIRKLLISQNKKFKSVLEIGCFPARFLPFFAEFGIELNGIDTTDRVYPDLYNYLINQNFKIGNIEKKDIYNLSLDKKYDIVCSFGFIEHFINFEKIIQLHCSIVEEDGLLIISVPNFSGIFQLIFRTIFDRENLQRHNLKAMNIKLWLNALNECNFKYEILFEGPLGGLEFWVDKFPKNKMMSKLLNCILRYSTKINNKGVSNSNFYSPYKMLILKKI